jgi:hypothetical protein
VLRVRQAAALIGGSHDLLATHLDGDGSRSDIAPLIRDVTGRRQVTITAATLARAVADVVSTVGPAHRDPTRIPNPRSASRHLRWGAGIVSTAAGWSAPTPDYLLAVAGLEPLRRIPVVAGESRERLLQEVLAGAQRLHGAALRDSQQPGGHRARSLRTVATGMAASHAICAQLLAQLNGPASLLLPAALAPEAVSGLIDATRYQQSAFRAWLHVCDSWQGVTGLAETAWSAEVRLETNDLVTRLGRLAYREPDWIPRPGMAGMLRDPADLAPDVAAFAALTHAMQELTSLSALIAADHARLSVALAAVSELLVPTATLPEDYNVPYRFAPIPGPTDSRLIQAYDHARGAACDAATPLSSVAVIAEAAAPMLGRRQQIELTAMRVAGLGHQHRVARSECAPLEIEL